MAGLVVLVTGANQGLGFATIEVAAQQDPSSCFILCSRSIAAGNEAKQKLEDSGISASINVVELDVTKDSDILAAVSFVEEKFGRLDVLVNNAGILVRPADDSLGALRAVYTELCSVNLTSCALVTHAFLGLLHHSANPKVINVTSGLGSIENALTKKMGRFPPYGASKIGMNGAAMHQQTAELDRVAGEATAGISGGDAMVRFFVVTPGVLRTTFTGFKIGKEPREGAEAVVRLMLDRANEYQHAKNWEFEGGEMRIVPW